jgi:uncharacterized caspase-like protein
VQANGLNYLIPVDARISREGDIKYQSVQVDWVLDRMRDAGNELNVIILDACRNNPSARSWRTAQPGLAVMQAVSGSLIGYATSPGTTAEDGAGRNGTYTKHLLNFMQVPSLSAEQMFKEVRVAVAQETGKKQIPWVSIHLTPWRLLFFGEITGATGLHAGPQRLCFSLAPVHVKLCPVRWD